jgi:hypothetical protein
LISSILYWLDYNKTKASNNVLNALSIVKQSLTILTYDFIQILRANQATSLINDISLLDVDYRDICNDIMNFLINQANMGNIDSVYQNVKTKAIQMSELTEEVELDDYTLNVNKHILNYKQSFPMVNISKEDVQKVFDNNINLKFGDSIQTSKTLNVIYHEIIKNYPIEYFLQNTEMFKTFFVFLERANFFEFGMIIWKIMDRCYFLLEKKLQYFKETYMTVNNTGMKGQLNTSVSPNNMKSNNFSQLYPNVNLSINETMGGLSVRDFLVLSMESLIGAMYDLDKFTLAFHLLDKNFTFFKKIISDGEDDDLIAIFTQLIKRLNSLLNYYKTKNIIPLKRFFVKFLNNFNDKFFVKFLQTATPDIIGSIKEVVFNINDNKIVSNFFNKIEKIKTLLVSEKLLGRNNTLIEQLSSIIEDYNNAEIMRSSINIAKNLKKQDDYTYILDNFLNIIITVNYNNYQEENNVSTTNIENSVLNTTEKQSQSNTSIGNFIISGISHITKKDISVLIKKDFFPFIKVLCEAYEKNLNKNKISVCLRKLLSFCNFGACGVGFKFTLYSSILEAIELKPMTIFGILRNDPSILLLFLNDLNEEALLKEIILNIIYEATKYFKNIRDTCNILIHIFEVLPYYPKLFKITSVHSHMDCELDHFSKNRKYLRNLFSIDEIVRLNSINYFTTFGIQINKKAIEFVEFNQNYENIKSIDTIYIIQSAERELSSSYKALTSDDSYNVEFYPLLNIVYSEKMEYNMKTSALDQLVYLVGVEKYRNIFTSDVLNYLIENIIRTLMAKDEYGVDVLNYMSSLLKLVDLIFLFNLYNPNVQEFLCTDDHSASAWLLAKNLIAKILFKKSTSRHLLATFSIAYVFMFSFIKLPMELSVNDDHKSYTLPSVFEGNFFNIIPTMDYKPFNNSEKAFWEKLTINKYIMDYIKNSEKAIQNTFDIVALRRSMKEHFNDKDGAFSYIDIYYTTLRYFNYLIYNYYCRFEFDKETNNDLMLLINLMKKLLPLHSKDKNVICDIYNILNIFHNISRDYKTDSGFNLILVRNFSDISLTYVNFLINTQSFVETFDDQNELLLTEIITYLIQILSDAEDKNITLPTCPLYPFYKYKAIVFKFNDIFANILVYNDRFDTFRTIFIKFQFQLLKLDTYNKDLSFTNNIKSTINNIDIYFNKLDLTMISSFKCYNSIMSYLKYLVLVSDSFGSYITNRLDNMIKFIPIWTFSDIPDQILVLLTNLISPELLSNSPMLISVIYDLFLEQSAHCLIKINCLNFINGVLEHIMRNRTIDVRDMYDDVISMNETLFEEGTVLLLLNLIERSKFNSHLFACILRLINNILIIINEKERGDIDIYTSIFLNSAFYNCVNYLTTRELENIGLPHEFGLNDKKFISKLNTHLMIESILGINELLTLVIKSLSKIDFKTIISNCGVINLSFEDIFRKLLEIVKAVKQWRDGNIKDVDQIVKSHFQNIMGDLATKVFTFLHFIYVGDEIFIYNLILSQNTTDLFDTLYMILKWDEDNVNNINIRLSFAKILPHILETINLLQQNEYEIVLKNEGDILLELMTAFKIIYEIKMDSYEVGIKCKFNLEDDSNISHKVVLVNAISAILLDSQNTKHIFVMSGFINNFFDYIRQITEQLFTSAINPTSVSKTRDLLGMTKQFNMDYLLNELKNVLILLQNFVFNYKGFEDKKTEKEFIRLLYDIFLETMRHSSELIENYVKLLINYISQNEEAKKTFTLPLSKFIFKLDKTGNETFLGIILDYFNKSFISLSNHPSLEILFKFLKCLFQNKNVIVFLMKIKFIENLTKDIIGLLTNKRYMSNPANNKFTGCLLGLLTSLSFDTDVSKKIATKEFIEILTELLIKTKQENIIYNTLFLLRNFSFVSANKLHFMVNDNLLGTIFALLSSDSMFNYSVKIKQMISHLIWVLLFNNQSVNVL